VAGAPFEVIVDKDVTVLVFVREHEAGQVTRLGCVVVVVGCAVVVVVVAAMVCKRQEHTELASAAILA
jgi:hypothetical protein